MFSDNACRGLRLILAYASMVVVFLMEWFHSGSAKDLEVIIPAMIGGYHLGEYYIRKSENDNQS